jgi:hypothetical protein
MRVDLPSCSWRYGSAFADNGVAGVAACRESNVPLCAYRTWNTPLIPITWDCAWTHCRMKQVRRLRMQCRSITYICGCLGLPLRHHNQLVLQRKPSLLPKPTSWVARKQLQFGRDKDAPSSRSLVMHQHDRSRRLSASVRGSFHDSPTRVRSHGGDYLEQHALLQLLAPNQLPACSCVPRLFCVVQLLEVDFDRQERRNTTCQH